MPIPKPESGWIRFWKSESPFDLLSAFAGIASGGGAAYRFFTTPANTDPRAFEWGWIVLTGTAVAALSQIGKAVRKAYLESSANSPHHLAGCLHTLNGVLLAGSDIQTAGLRSTVYVPDSTSGRPNHLIQALDYVGDQRQKDRMRREADGQRRSVHTPDEDRLRLR
jgi:hypothetical protein